MSVSTRNRRATIYPYSPTTTAGRTTSSYGPSRGTFYCRFSQPRHGSEVTTAGQAAHRETGLFEFADATTVAVDDLIVLGNKQWKVSAPPVIRRRALIVDVYRNDDEPDLPLT